MGAPAVSFHNKIVYVKTQGRSNNESEAMKYETPELAVLTPAINAIHSLGGLPKNSTSSLESFENYESVGGYADWE